jgi:hypothetical protein
MSRVRSWRRRVGKTWTTRLGRGYTYYLSIVGLGYDYYTVVSGSDHCQFKNSQDDQCVTMSRLCSPGMDRKSRAQNISLRLPLPVSGCNQAPRPWRRCCCCKISGPDHLRRCRCLAFGACGRHLISLQTRDRGLPRAVTTVIAILCRSLPSRVKDSIRRDLI